MNKFRKISKLKKIHRKDGQISVHGTKKKHNKNLKNTREACSDKMYMENRGYVSFIGFDKHKTRQPCRKANSAMAMIIAM